MNRGAKHGQLATQGKGRPFRRGFVPCLSPDGAVSKSGAPPRILVVEDQEDVRRMVVTALQIEGYDVSEAASAHEGLRRLEERHYNLVLSDYAMPGGTGSWMLQEAARRRLMDGRTSALIVTAHPDVRDLANVAVINKPLDLDDFLEQVRKILGSRPVGRPEAEPHSHIKPHPVELVLYISSTSKASLQARENLERQLARFDSALVHCTVVDLLEKPLAGEADRIAFTPTLVRTSPAPRTWILGNLRHDEILIELLESAGIAATG